MVLQALSAEGELLKASAKSFIRRVGPWVVKTSRPRGGLEIVKRTFHRGRYRRAWIAATCLEPFQIVPRAYAFVEAGYLGVIARNALVLEYLEGWCNVEVHADRLVARQARPDEIDAFLARLADAVSVLEAARAYHEDLSGKNILTREGVAFRFIDLDGVTLGRPYTETMRLRNHTQLYDSFCDRWDDARLQPFIRRMLPEDYDIQTWMETIRIQQVARRARTLARRRKRR